MSIENKIDQLIAAIDALTKTIVLTDIVRNDDGAKGVVNNVVVTEDKKPVEVPEDVLADATENAHAETTQEVTHDELKKYCLAQVRENPAFKDQLAKAMDGFGVKTLSKLKAEHVQTLAKMVGMV